MYSLALLLLLGFVLSLGLTPVVRRVAIAANWCDEPDDFRKTHGGRIPRAGGVAVLAAFGGSLAISLWLPLTGTQMIREEVLRYWAVFPGALLVFGVGLADDLIGLSPRKKLAGQLAAALLVFAGGIRVEAIGGHSEGNWWWSLPLTVVWLALCTNAFNLVDGMDGLASGLGLFAAVAVMGAGLVMNNLALSLVTAALVGALAGFLRYNFNPATIFLGDCGSLTIGFLLGCHAVVWSQKAATLAGMAAPLMAVAIPVADTALAVLRRLVRRRPLFEGDRSHIHHRLLDLGWSPRRAALVLYGVATVGAALSLVSSARPGEHQVFVVVVFAAAVLGGVGLLRYPEWQIVRNRIVEAAGGRAAGAEMRSRTAAQLLDESRNFTEMLYNLDVAVRELGYESYSLEVNGERYRTGDPIAPNGVVIDVRDGCRLTLAPASNAMAVRAKGFRDALGSSLKRFEPGRGRSGAGKDGA